MALSLFPHNQAAYEEALQMMQEVGKAAVIHPTGTGKSFIAFHLALENPQKTICWLSPSEYIFKTQLENLAAANDGVLPQNIQFYTYAKLVLLTDSELVSIQPDYIILDEFHRCGAQVWGQGVQRLLQYYPAVPVLELSATNIRYLDNQRDMADELFDGNVASHITLGEALVRGILHTPTYIQTVYSYQKSLEKLAGRVYRAKKRAIRDKAEMLLESLRRALERADGLDVVFYKHMPKKTGKYIVFCANKEHMDEMKEKAGEWFRLVDPQPHVYEAYSESPETEQAFRDFKADDSEHLKLLYCIDMQWNNRQYQYWEKSYAESKAYYESHGKLNPPTDYKSNGIALKKWLDHQLSLYKSGKLSADRKQRLDDIGMIWASRYDQQWEEAYNLAKAYFAEHGNLKVPVNHKQNGVNLETWLYSQRSAYKSGKLSIKRQKALQDIGMQFA